MGKKKQDHLQQSMGTLVSRAALTQLGPDIQRLVEAHINNLGSNLALKQSQIIGTVANRLATVEQLLMAKSIITKDEYLNKIADIEDSLQDLAPATVAQAGDTVRVQLATLNANGEFEDNVLMKLSDLGKSQAFDTELQEQMYGLATGHTKFVKYANTEVRIVMDRVARPKKENLDAAQG